ncbi:UNVERIFIED_CONTAM: hypothetical protein FKN15_063700 [Acipenser sinensis]
MTKISLVYLLIDRFVLLESASLFFILLSLSLTPSITCRFHDRLAVQNVRPLTCVRMTACTTTPPPAGGDNESPS